MVTSSAVVGSSHRISFGSHDSAIAIMMRWRRPPESSCGYARARRSGSGMPTRRIRSSARSRGRASATEPRCTCGPSAIWSPTRMTGLSAVIGSWKIIAIAPPRTSSEPAGRAVTRSSPSNSTSPPTIYAGAAAGRGSRAASCSCRSPTRRRARAPRPARPSNDTPSTAWTVPRASGSSTRRSRTSRSRRRAHSGRSRSARPSPISESPSPVMTTARPGIVVSCHCVGEERLPVGDHRPPVGRRRLDAEAQVAERDDQQDVEHDVGHREHDRLGDDVREEVAHDDARAREARRLGGERCTPGVRPPAPRRG